MAQESLSQRWSDFRPSKALWFWSCIVCIAGTMIIGFTAGGWVTGGTAKSMAQTAAEEGRTQLAATLCVNKFVASGNSTAFAELKEASSWNRDDIIEKGGWAKINGVDDEISGVADACAEQIAAMDSLPATATGTVPETTAAATTKQEG
jgi:hypothetical protein